MKKIGNLIATIIMIVCIAFAAWITVSYIDIIADNSTPNPQHYDWNFFVVTTSK